MKNELGKAAGGTVVETKGGKFIIVPPNTKEFGTKEEAEKMEKCFRDIKDWCGNNKNPKPKCGCGNTENTENPKPKGWCAT